MIKRIKDLEWRIENPCEYFGTALLPDNVVDAYVNAWTEELKYLRDIQNESQKAHNDVLNAIASGLENPSIVYPMDNPKDDNIILK